MHGEVIINLYIIADTISVHVNIEIPDDEQYERIKLMKNEYGLTWRGMLIHAADDLETPAGELPVVRVVE